MTSAVPPKPDNAGAAKPAVAPTAHLRAVIATSDRVVFDGVADAVTALASRGALTILLHHAPMLTMLEPGELVIRHAGETTTFFVEGGCLEVADDVVTILAENAERPGNIDLSVAEAAVRDAQAMIKRYRSRPEAAMLALRRARARLHAARKAGAARGSARS